MTAYYNENNPHAAATLRNLIVAGVIAPGYVDTRSIEDVRPGDIAGFTQCHFFAGIGVWSYALRLAGWPDDRRVWTGSCPCQPFSAAGKGGGFDDERHLWPAWFHLITNGTPPVVLGEQVASKDGLAWLDLVHTDMERAGYAVEAKDLCAAGFGAPHIRQRLFFVADAEHGRRATRQSQWSWASSVVPSGAVDWLAHSDHAGLEVVGLEPSRRERATSFRGRASCGVADDDDDDDDRLGAKPLAGLHDAEHHVEPRGGARRPGPTNGHWRDVDWLLCRDDKWRPVEPGTFPLAHGVAGRVGLLRGYGNAIVPQVAAAFIEAYLEATGT